MSPSPPLHHNILLPCYRAHLHSFQVIESTTGDKQLAYWRTMATRATTTVSDGGGPCDEENVMKTTQVSVSLARLGFGALWTVNPVGT